MMDTKKNSKLQNARLAAGMSQSQLASAAGLNVRTLQCYEQGVKDLNGAKLATLSETLPCPGLQAGGHPDR